MERGPCCASSHDWQLDMFGAKPDADQAGWNAAQQRRLPEQPQSERRRQFFGALQNLPDHPVLDEQLEPLCCASRELPAALDRVQVVLAGSSMQKARGQ